MAIQKGTKLTDSPKNNSLKFRYDEETRMKLEEIASATGQSKAEIIRTGINLQHHKLKTGRYPISDDEDQTATEIFRQELDDMRKRIDVLYDDMLQRKNEGTNSD